MGYVHIERLLKELETLDRERIVFNALAESGELITEPDWLFPTVTNNGCAITIYSHELSPLATALGNQIRKNLECFRLQPAEARVPSKNELLETAQLINFLEKIIFSARKEKWLIDDGQHLLDLLESAQDELCFFLTKVMNQEKAG